MLTRTPLQITPEIPALAGRLAPSSTPTFIQVLPHPHGFPNECFGTVELKVHESGGAVQHGWAIWEWPGVMIEAEFHAVWKSPDGFLNDVTPRVDSETHILFVADHVRVFEGKAIDNVRVPLREDPRIREFIGLAEKKYEILNRGERARQFGPIAIPKEEIAPVLLRMVKLQAELSKPLAGRNDPCPCGSGRKFKKCHGAS